jgi:hypothetical protein
MQEGARRAGAEVPGGPASTTDQDALWQLAPDGARVGFVASPRGVAMLERGALAIDALITGAPDLAPLRHRLEQAWTRVIDFLIRPDRRFRRPRPGAAESC